MPSLNELATNIQGSATIGAANAPCLHPDPINLAVGEPAELPPPEVEEAAHRALRDGLVRYGSPRGLPALRDRLAAEHTSRTGIAVSAEDVVMTIGGKQALIGALRCMVQPGDEVLILAPYWPSFVQMTEWCGARPVIVTSEGLVPDPDRVRAACTERTRALIVNSPSNPSGRVYDAATMRGIMDVAIERDLWVLSDEVYRALSLDGPAATPLSVAPEAAERVVAVDSFSKRFAMTGYRVGAAIAPRELIDAMTRLITASTTHPATFAQHAAIAALELDGTWEELQMATYRARRAAAMAALAPLDGIDAETPEGGMYVLPRITDRLARIGCADDVEFADRARDEAGVRIVAGTPFGVPGHVRLSCCVEESRLAEAIERLDGIGA